MRDKVLVAVAVTLILAASAGLITYWGALRNQR
jgi:hypothetical protein